MSQNYNIHDERVCALERALELLRMTTDTIDYTLRDPDPDERLIETNLQLFYRIRKMPPFGNNLITIEKLAVAADIASIEAYSRISEIEKLDSAVPEQTYRKLMRSLARCTRLLYSVSNATNHIRMSREHLSRRKEIAGGFKTYQFH